ncbi:MAG TPA: PSD1 and planctomycete cytochrome C domain-containing protein [Gemmataceae bacterium]|nr:PSD1 and planctomycete cytochrome C domain-containing protein [Gemmataceae bacterium]
MRYIVVISALILLPGPLFASNDAVDFNRDIRPILAENCFSCHGQDASKRKAKLRLDERQSAIDAGAIAPKNTAASELIQRIFADDPDTRMPPLKSNRKLSAEQKDLLKRWIEEGAEYKPHWAFVAPVRPVLPKVKQSNWVRNPIDAFIMAKLETEGLKPSPETDRVTLLRRLYSDLIGLPPTPQEVDAFVADKSDNAYEKLVDKLLASKHYGERLALPWLDTARYADSNGFQQDGDTWQWYWRDWVVKALNDDLPFDQFTIWQLAGDLLPSATIEQKIASGFNRNHLLNGEGGAIAEEQRFVNLFDRIDTTATTWLGLTMACAQCHDHKYDPITMRDYYSMMDAFNRVPETGMPKRFSDRIRVAPPFIELPTEENKAKIRDLEALIAKAEKKEQKDALNKKLTEYKNDQIPRVMVMSDAKPRKTFILDRGEYLKPKEPVSFATPAFLPPMPKDSPPNRLGLARWLIAPENALTARVQVNRMWQHFFGTGLVKTSEDLGVQGEYPIHGPLLDWLAVEFRERGWSMKQMHRLIVTSATYRQSSKMTAEHKTRDPENRLYARASRFRMPAMILRDLALSSSGLLQSQIGGAPVYPYQPDQVWEPLAITKERDFTYPASKGNDLYRRSLYTFWRRTISPANIFDASSRQACRVRQSLTSTPLHALTTLNDPTWVEAARVLAEKSIKASPNLDERLTYAFRQVVSRKPSENDLKILTRAFEKQAAIYKAEPKSARAFLSVGASTRDETVDLTEHAAMTAVSLAILNLDEALTRE